MPTLKDSPKMDTHTFTLIVSGITEDKLDDLYEAGCDDATVSVGPQPSEVEFAREASSLTDAIVSAIKNVETVAGVTVVRVEPDQMVWASEIAERTGRSRQNIDQLVKGTRGPGGFPSPVTGTTRNPLWRWSEVEQWFATKDGAPPVDPERTAVTGAINAALEARRNARTLTDRHLRSALQHLIAS